MLQHNTTDEGDVRGGAGGRKAHLAHAAMVGLHLLCCGAPIVALALASASSSFNILATLTGALHQGLHAREALLLILSAALVTIGGFMEWRARRGARGVPVLFAVSLACFVANLVLFGAHRLGPI